MSSSALGSTAPSSHERTDCGRNLVCVVSDGDANEDVLTITRLLSATTGATTTTTTSTTTAAATGSDMDTKAEEGGRGRVVLNTRYYRAVVCIRHERNDDDVHTASQSQAIILYARGDDGGASIEYCMTKWIGLRSGNEDESTVVVLLLRGDGDNTNVDDVAEEEEISQIGRQRLRSWCARNGVQLISRTEWTDEEEKMKEKWEDGVRESLRDALHCAPWPDMQLRGAAEAGRRMGGRETEEDGVLGDLVRLDECFEKEEEEEECAGHEDTESEEEWTWHGVKPTDGHGTVY